jgi:abortive infection bacteriophage resistance protein
LSGYFRAFQIDPSHGNNRFRNGTHIRDFMIPYLMDEQLRLLILRGTSSLEQTLRAHFAYYLAQTEEPTPTRNSAHIRQSNIPMAPKPEKF